VSGRDGRRRSRRLSRINHQGHGIEPDLVIPMRLGAVRPHEDRHSSSLGHCRDPQLRENASQFVPHLRAPDNVGGRGISAATRVYADLASNELALVSPAALVVRCIGSPADSSHVGRARGTLHLLIDPCRERQPRTEYLLSRSHRSLASTVESRGLHRELHERGPTTGYGTVGSNLVEGVELAVDSHVARVLAGILRLSRRDTGPKQQQQRNQGPRQSACRKTVHVSPRQRRLAAARPGSL